MLVLVSIRQRGFLLPGAAVGLLVVASIILQGAYPAAIQRLRVDPQELAREEPFIDRNLDATRDAYGLDDVELQPFDIANDLDEADVIENDVTLRNVRLWEPERPRDDLPAAAGAAALLPVQRGRDRPLRDRRRAAPGHARHP